MSRLATILRRHLSSSADAAAFLRQKKASDSLATTTSVAERLRNSTSNDVVTTPKDPKLSSFYSQTVGSGRVDVDNTTGKKPKLTSMYTKDSHID